MGHLSTVRQGGPSLAKAPIEETPIASEIRDAMLTDDDMVYSSDVESIPAPSADPIGPPPTPDPLTEEASADSLGDEATAAYSRSAVERLAASLTGPGDSGDSGTPSTTKPPAGAASFAETLDDPTDVDTQAPTDEGAPASRRAPTGEGTQIDAGVSGRVRAPGDATGTRARGNAQAPGDTQARAEARATTDAPGQPPHEPATRGHASPGPAVDEQGHGRSVTNAPPTTKLGDPRPAATAAMFPSRIPPPLIHDPRANRRFGTLGPPRKHRSSLGRSLVIGLMAGLLAIGGGIGIAVWFLKARGSVKPLPTPSVSGESATTPAAPSPATTTAAVLEPATATDAGSDAASDAGSTARADAARERDAAPEAAAASAASATASAAVTPPPPVPRRAYPRRPRPSTPKAPRTKFVPEDI